jgi:hypothetical protein
MRISRASRASWQEKLYGFVDPDDLRALAVEPLEAAERTYRWAQLAAIAAYSVVILALVLLAVQPPPKRADAEKQGGTVSATPTSGPKPGAIPTAASAAAARQPRPEPANPPGKDTSASTPFGANPKQKASGASAAHASREAGQAR